MATLGVLLRRHRENAQLTQEDLAERAGLSARTISDIERGMRSRVYGETADRLTSALRLTDADRTAFRAAARGDSRVVGTPEASRVPRPLTPLLGRDREVAVLVDALGTRGSRLVTVTGLGGVGKSRLALEAAAALEPEFAGRVHYFSVPSNQSPENVHDLVARHIGLAERTLDGIAAELVGRPTLVVVDSFEHVLSAAPGIEALLTAAPELHMIVTSRERLGINGEQELRLDPLALPDPSDARWFQAPAAALFLQRVHAVLPDLEADPRLVADICSAVSGLPLALELAAARVRHLPLAALRDRLTSGIDDLTDPRAWPDRHRSLTQTLRLTTDALSAAEAQALAVASLFPGGMRLDAAEAVCGDMDVLGVLSSLVDKSLLRVGDSPPLGPVPRWRMLDVVRQFVLASPTLPLPVGCRSAFIAFHTGLATSLAAKLGRESQWFGPLAVEEANIRAALAWAGEEGDAESVLRLCGGMWQYWQAGGDLTEGRQWLQRGLTMTPPASDGTRMVALWGAGWLAYHQADDSAADACATELESLAHRCSDDLARRHALTLQGMLAISRDEPAMAERLLANALEVARRVGTPWVLATSFLNLGMAQLCGGDTHRARSVLAEAISGYATIGDERFHARCLGYLGYASLLEGDPALARALFMQSLATFRLLGEPGGSAEGLLGLAAVYAATGQPERAAVLGSAGERLHESYAGRALPLERRTARRYLALAQAALDPETWTEASARGRRLALADALELALDD